MASSMPSYRIIVASSRHLVIINAESGEEDDIDAIFIIDPSPTQEALFDDYADIQLMLNDGGPAYRTVRMEIIMDEDGSVVTATFLDTDDSNDEAAMVIANFVASYDSLHPNGLLESETAQVKEHSFKIGEKSEEEGEICVICQEEYEEDEMIGTLECRHGYHANCIKKWLLEKNVCPICRAKV